MASPEIIEHVMQKSGWDCGIAVLAMLLGQPYVEVHRISKEFYPDEEDGLSSRQMSRIGKVFGAVLKASPDITDGSTGALLVRLPKNHYHWVALFEGVIIDPGSGLMYTQDAYKASKHATAYHFYTL